MSEANDKPAVDMNGIEREYIAGVRSLRDIAAQFGVSEGVIRKYAKKRGWVRDLKEKIKNRTEEIVRKEAVRSTVRTDNERTIIETNAQMQANIILSHRPLIGRTRNLFEAIIEEIEVLTGERVTYEQLGEIMNSGDDEGMERIYKKAISLGNRVDCFKKAVDTLKVLIGLERQAFGLSDNSNGDADKPKEVTPAPTGDFLSATIAKLNEAHAAKLAAD